MLGRNKLFRRLLYILPFLMVPSASPVLIATETIDLLNTSINGLRTSTPAADDTIERDDDEVYCFPLFSVNHSFSDYILPPSPDVRSH